jgi:hypothetical protein
MTIRKLPSDSSVRGREHRRPGERLAVAFKPELPLGPAYLETLNM